MINKIIRNFIAKQIAGRSDDGIMITLKDPQRVTLGENILADTLMRNGIDPRTITSEQQLKNILNQIKAVETQSTTTSGIRNTESAKIFDLEGKEIPPGSKIMGGTQADKEVGMFDDIFNKMQNEMKGLKSVDDKPPPGSRGGTDDIAAPVQSQEETLKNMFEAENKKAIDNLKQKMAKEKSRTQRISGNLRAENSQRVEIGKAKLDEDEYNYYREILGENAEMDYYPVKGDETKELLEAMVKEQKDEVAYMKRLYDKGGLDDPDKKADGGRAGYFFGGKVGLKILNLLKNKKKVKAAYDNIFPSGDYKYDAEMVAESLVENNPKVFGNRLYGDLTDAERAAVYGAGLEEASTNFAKQLKLKRTMDKASKPTKTLKGIEKTGTIDISDPEVAEEFARFMKETSPGDAKKLEQTLELSNLKTKNRKPNADGGRIGLKDGLPPKLRKLYERMLKHDDQPTTIDKSILRDLIEAMEGQGASPNYNVKEDLPKEVSARDGGIMRLGLKEGSGMSRRTFLKILGGAASIPIIGKIFKPFKIGKTVTKVPIIKTDAVPGKPEWFDQLVNKVILEGDDVTKRFATAERQSIHQKTLNNGAVVRVTEDIDDGAVRVEYESPENVYGEPVQMQYKKPLPDEGDPRPVGEFDTAESGAVGKADGPDDYSIEIDEVGGKSIKDLDSDVSILKEYATGQKPNIKELLQNIKRKDRAKAISEGGEAEMDAIIARQGEFIEPDFASGGIARMLGE